MHHTSVETGSQQAGKEQDQSDRLGEIYTFLAECMRYPEDAQHTTLLVETLVAFAHDLGWEKEEEGLKVWLATCPDIFHDLRIEYTRLFITAARGCLVPPYASVYMKGEGYLNGHTTGRIRDFYRSQGFDISSEVEPADHLFLQLDFLAALTHERRHDEEEQFLLTIFRPWFTRFHSQCLQMTTHPFYRAVCMLIDFFTKEEQ